MSGRYCKVAINGVQLTETRCWIDDREPSLTFSVTPQGAVRVTYPEVPNSTAEVEAHHTARSELRMLLKTSVSSEVCIESLKIVEN